MTRAKPLIEAVAAAFATHGRTKGPGAAMGRECARILRSIDVDAAKAGPPPNHVPAARWMEPLLTEAARGPGRSIAAALRPLLPSLHWVRTYSKKQLGADYLENYGYFEVASPERGLVRTDAIETGFLVIGPGKLYPEHYHPAVELYHVVAGAPDWKIDRGDWGPRPAGSFIFHKTMAVHAMRTRETPLLALYAWLGDLKTGAKLGWPACAASTSMTRSATASN